MKSVAISAMVFIALFAAGFLVIGKIMPKDRAESTASYTEKVDVYVPPNVKSTASVKEGGMTIAAISLAEYKATASKEGSINSILPSAPNCD